MNKKMLLILCVLLIFFPSSCKKQEVEELKVEDKFSIKAAANVIDVYMKDLMNEDMENVKKHFSKELAEKTKEIKENEMKIKGYTIDEVSEIGESGIFKLKAIRINLDRPNSSLDEYTIKVIREEQNYKISEVNCTTEKEAFMENEKIRIRIKDNIKTNLLIDKGGIPEYIYSEDDKAKTNKLLVPKKNFNSLCFSYTGTSVGTAISDENNAFIGIVNIDETLAVQGEEQGGGEEQQQSPGIDMGPKETPIGKNLVPVDILKNSTIDFMIFTNDEKHLIVQYTQKDMGKNIRIYKSDSGEIIDLKFEDIYSLDKFEVKLSSTDKESVIYEVLPQDNENFDNENLGKWKLNLEDMKVEKI